jgi:hypothetical protein
MARDGVGLGGVGRKVGEVGAPWTHDVAAESRGADVDPIGRVGDLTDAGISRRVWMPVPLLQVVEVVRAVSAAVF